MKKHKKTTMHAERGLRKKKIKKIRFSFVFFSVLFLSLSLSLAHRTTTLTRRR